MKCIISLEDCFIKAEELHNWYLESIEDLDKENYNKKAKKPFSELTNQQRFIDQYIALQINKKIRNSFIKFEYDKLDINEY